MLRSLEYGLVLLICLAPLQGDAFHVPAGLTAISKRSVAPLFQVRANMEGSSPIQVEQGMLFCAVWTNCRAFRTDTCNFVPSSNVDAGFRHSRHKLQESPCFFPFFCVTSLYDCVELL
jgi:hypothetical protein